MYPYIDNYAKLPCFVVVLSNCSNYHKDMGALALPCTSNWDREKILFFISNCKKTIGTYRPAHSASYQNWQVNFFFRLGTFAGKITGTNGYLYSGHSLESFEKRGVTDEDIAKFKGGIEAQQINGLQSVSGKVSQFAAFQTFTGNPNKIAELLKMYTAVTKEDVMRVYNEYIKGKNAV